MTVTSGRRVFEAIEGSLPASHLKEHEWYCTPSEFAQGNQIELGRIFLIWLRGGVRVAGVLFNLIVRRMYTIEISVMYI